eukprot:Em0329g8a
MVPETGGTKLERCRELFEQCLETCPPKHAKLRVILTWVMDNQPHHTHLSDEATAEMEQLAKANTNPEEINIGDSDEMKVPRLKVRLEQQTIPSAVFGSIPEET